MNLKKIILNHTFLYELYFLLLKKKINRKKLDKKLCNFLDERYYKTEGLIVSLTSYGERLPDLKYTLYSLIDQTIRPEATIVWLAHDEPVTTELHQFERFGIEFRFCDDIKSYKKLVPTLKEFQDKCIVTADDDIFFEKRWLEKLWNEHLKYPHDKITHIAHEVSFDSDGRLLPYNKWAHNVRAASGGKIWFPTGGGGTLYPPHPVHPDFLDERLYMRLAPNADDVWFYFMGILSGQSTRIVRNPCNRLKYVDIYKEYGLNGKTTLQSVNVAQNQNDVQIRAVMDYFNISDKQLHEMVRR